MSIFKKIIQDLRQTHKDEREQHVQQSSSWTATIVLFVIYLVIGMIYTIRGELVPWSTEILFIAPLITFAYLTIKYEGYHFRIPGLVETKKTLNQPAAIRSVPWLMIVQIIALYPIQNLATALRSYLYHGASLETLIISILMPLIVGGTIAYYLAGRIKAGDSVWIGLTRITNLIAIPFNVFILVASYFTPFQKNIFISDVLSFNHLTDSNPTAALGLSLIISIWIFYVLAWHGKRMVNDGRPENVDPDKPWTLEEKIIAFITRRQPERYLYWSLGFYVVFNALNVVFKETLMIPLIVTIGLSSFLGFWSLIFGAIDLVILRKKIKNKWRPLALIILIIVANTLIEQYLM